MRCTAVVRPGDIIVFDGPACFTAHRQPVLATASLPDPAQFRKVLCVGADRAFEKIA